MSMGTIRWVGVVAMLTLVIVAGGCSSGPRYGAYDVNVALDEKLKRNNSWPTFEVDLVAIGEDEKTAWDAAKVGEYFSAGNSLRDGKKLNGESYTMTFSNSNPPAQTLSRKDPIWNKWGKKPELYVVANLREYTDQTDQQGLFRRKVVPLDKQRWNNSQSIGLVIRPDGIKYTTDPLPEPTK